MNTLFFILSIIFAGIAILSMILKDKKKINPKLAWAIWGTMMALWGIFCVLGYVYFL